MLFKDITIIDENIQVQKNRYVGIEDSRIVYVGKEEPKKDFGQTYDGKDKLLMSGFFNAHGHSPMTLMRGYGENMALADWLNTRIFPFEEELDEHAVYQGTMLAMAESIRFGIVSTTDMYFFPDAALKAVIESGTKNNFSRAIACADDSNLWDLPGAVEMKKTYEKYHNTADGRIKIDMGLHAEYTSTPKIAKQIGEYTKKIKTNMHLHLSETKQEHEECKKRHSLTPAAYFNRQGLFDTPTTAAHCVWLEDEDMEILKEKGVTVASNPVSNLKLASGVANVPALLEKGINVAIGTDGVASNNSLNFIEEIKYFATTSKGKQLNPLAVTPKEAIYAATAAGAKAQDRTDCGTLAVGNKADLIVLDISGPNMFPAHNLLNNLVYSASGSDVVLTMVDGKTLYQDGEYVTIDLEKTKYEVKKATEGILRRI